MTAPLLYATVAELKAVLSGTDSGTGTAAQLTETQLTLAMQAGTNRVSAYVGSTYDSSTPQAVPPPLIHDLALDLAAFWATKTYLKHKKIDPQDPVYLAYKDAMKLLEDIRDGRVRADPAVVGGMGQEVGVVINRIPRVFTADDSNVEIDTLTGALQASTPDWMWSPSNDLLDTWGPEFQG